MGLRFRKSIKLGGGFRLNLSKSGVGYSWGTKGFRISKSAKGRTRKTFSVPGTGISYSTSSGKSKRRKSTTAKQNYSQSNTDFTEQLPVDPKVQRIKKTAITAIIAGLVLMMIGHHESDPLHITLTSLGYIGLIGGIILMVIKNRFGKNEFFKFFVKRKAQGSCSLTKEYLFLDFLANIFNKRELFKSALRQKKSR